MYSNNNSAYDIITVILLVFITTFFVAAGCGNNNQETGEQTHQQEQEEQKEPEGDREKITEENGENEAEKDDDNGNDKNNKEDEPEERQREGFYMVNNTLKYNGIDLFQKDKKELTEFLGEPESIDHFRGSELYTYKEEDIMVGVDPYEDNVRALYCTSGEIFDFNTGMTFKEIEEILGKPDIYYYDEEEFQEHVVMYNLEGYTVRIFAEEKDAATSYVQIQKQE